MVTVHKWETLFGASYEVVVLFSDNDNYVIVIKIVL